MRIKPHNCKGITKAGEAPPHNSVECGKILADLGADVIQIEPPGGHAARRIGPFYRHEVQAERSLYWWAYAANKRSITLDITSPEGHKLFPLNLSEFVDG
jgi:crotonobetainyl-CoA:carnitine CoA-transferase CaiB-like acyl-CoA transferase